MIDAQRIYQIGEFAVTRVTETRIEFSPPDRLLPDWKPDTMAGYEQQLAPSHPADMRERIVTSVHTWVVSTSSTQESASAKRGQ